MQKINSLYLANVQDLISSNDDSHSPYNDIYKKVLHTNVSLVDRTEKIVMPYKFQLYSDFKMPTDLTNFNMSYTDCLLERAEELYSLSVKLKVPLKVYEFKYDSVKGRRQIGVLPGDAMRWFPESVDIVESYTFPSMDRSQPATILNNFPFVDKNGIFMHGVAALQQLVREYDALLNLQQGVILPVGLISILVHGE